MGTCVAECLFPIECGMRVPSSVTLSAEVSEPTSKKLLPSQNQSRRCVRQAIAIAIKRSLALEMTGLFGLLRE